MNVHTIPIQAPANDVRDALDDIHLATGTLKVALDHMHDLALNIRYDVAPDRQEMAVVHALLAMACAWAEQLDNNVGDASSQHSKALASRLA